MRRIGRHPNVIHQLLGRWTTFVLGNLRKAQSFGPLHKLSIERLTQDSAICPVITLKENIKCTLVRRNNGNISTPFANTTRPFQPVSSLTICRWIKDQFEVSGCRYKRIRGLEDHSIRGAMASKAAALRVSIQAIIKQGHWSRESTSQDYHRDKEGPANLLEAGILGIGMGIFSD